MTPPKVSVVIPVYNAASYLRQCLDSIVNQTLADIEIICVDDGSQDQSLDILQEYQKGDSRITILQQQNQYAGVARNNGMAKANGEYLAFLDADDFFELDMLEHAYIQCLKENADLCLWGADFYDTVTDTYTAFDLCLNTPQLPTQQPFCVNDHPEHIFQISCGVPWNKLYKRSMIQNNHILYPAVKRSEDSYFACLSLCCAQRITSINKYFVHYRQSHGDNHQATTDKAPLDWYQVHMQLKEALQSRGFFETVKLSYLKFCIGNGYAYLGLMRTFEGFHASYIAMQESLKIELKQQKLNYAQLPEWCTKICETIIPYTIPEHLFAKLRETKIQLEQIAQEIQNKDHHIESLQQTIQKLLQEDDWIFYNAQIISRKKLLRRYWRYSILAKITWGKKRRKYKIKRKDIRTQLLKIKH